MTRKILAALAATAGLAFASQASATVFAGNWELTAYSSSDPGLVLGYETINSSFNVDLAAFDPQVVPLFKLFTNESDIGVDDLALAQIQLKFTFTEPTGNNGPIFINGDTSGTSTWTWLGNFQGGNLTWDNGGQAMLQWGFDQPNLLDPGRMTITVNGGDFNVGWFGTNQGCNLFGHHCDPAKKGMTVKAKFDWDNDPTFGAVPEPATWALMIGGFGMAGAMIRRRRAVAFG